LLLGEAVEETARREVGEEVGLEVESLWYSASQHWPFPRSCVMIACHALVRGQQLEVSGLRFLQGISMPALHSRISFGPQTLAWIASAPSLNAFSS